MKFQLKTWRVIKSWPDKWRGHVPISKEVKVLLQGRVGMAKDETREVSYKGQSTEFGFYGKSLKGFKQKGDIVFFLKGWC